MAEGNTDRDVVQRCLAVVDRAVTGGVDGACLDTFTADLAALPTGSAEQGDLAAKLVMALTKGGRQVTATLVFRLDKLVQVADDSQTALLGWPETRASVRAHSLAHAVAYGQRDDLAALRQEFDELTKAAKHAPFVRMAVEGARQAVEAVLTAQASAAPAIPELIEDLSDKLGRLGGRSAAEAMRAALVTVQELHAAVQTGDERKIMDLLDVLSEQSAGLPADSGLREVVSQARAEFALITESWTRPGSSPEEIVDEVTELTGDGAPAADRVRTRLIAAGALFRMGEETDIARIDAAIGQCREAGAEDPTSAYHAFVLVTLGLGLFRRSEVTGSVAGLAEAEEVLVRALELLGGPQHPHWVFANEVLAGVRERIGDPVGSTEVGEDAQRSYALRALFEATPAQAREAVRDAVDGAIRLARNCLRQNQVSAAVRALDTCRGLLLFAEVELRNLPRLLREAGRPDLASRWEQEGRDTAGLRQEVVTELMAHPETAGRLLDPPIVDEIRAALRTAGADALVYLVPGQVGLPGLAVIAPAHGAPAYMALSYLSLVNGVEVERFLTALAGRSREAAPLEDDPREVAAVADSTFADTVDELCDWAWRAAVGPLLERYFARKIPGREPRIVLVPMGDLARVPWHAARRSDGVYAVQLAAFSQAVSARLFCAGAAKPPVEPGSTGLVVGDPDTEGAAHSLSAARVEAKAIRQAFYQGARYVGRRPDGSTSPSGRGTAEQVRAWLSDTGPAAGTTLHLACHGVFTSAAKNAKAALLLAPNRVDSKLPDELDTDEIVRTLAAVPERALGLVVMAACHTARSIHGYDEAYSLGTAFLAAGARTVLSTQWAVPDDSTSALMFMFHHHLRETGLAPGEALRQAQIWMLTPDRDPPASMPGELRRLSDARDHSRVVAWAGFVHGGQ